MSLPATPPDTDPTADIVQDHLEHSIRNPDPRLPKICDDCEADTKDGHEDGLRGECNKLKVSLLCVKDQIAAQERICSKRLEAIEAEHLRNMERMNKIVTEQQVEGEMLKGGLDRYVHEGSSNGGGCGCGKIASMRDFRNCLMIDGLRNSVTFLLKYDVLAVLFWTL